MLCSFLFNAVSFFVDINIALCEDREVRIIGREIIVKFKKKHERSRVTLIDFEEKIKQVKWKNYSDMKKTFNSVDNLGDDIYCFNIGGNSFRLEARVRIKLDTIRILEVLTHADYDKKNKRR